MACSGIVFTFTLYFLHVSDIDGCPQCVVLIISLLLTVENFLVEVVRTMMRVTFRMPCSSKAVDEESSVNTRTNHGEASIILV